MLRKPSPFSEFSRNRFCATVSSTAMGSGSSDFTRRPSTRSETCSPSSPYRLKSAAPNLVLKWEKVRDRLPSQMARTCCLDDLVAGRLGVERLGTSSICPLAVGELEQPVLDVGDPDVARGEVVDRVGPRGPHLGVRRSPPKRRSCTAAGSLIHWRLWMVTTCMAAVAARRLRLPRPRGRRGVVQRPS